MIIRAKIFACFLLTTWIMCGGAKIGLSQKVGPIASKVIGEELGIVIMGAIVSKKADGSVVLVKEKSNGRVSAFKVGHKVLTYPIEEIAKEYIVIRKDEKLVAVYQDKFAGSIGEVPAPEQAVPTPIAGGGNYSEDGFERTDPGNDKEIEVKMTEAYRDSLIKNKLATVLMQATATPTVEDGVIVGFELSQLDQGSIFEKGGFMNFDVVTAVNGIPLDSVSGAVKLLNSLRQADTVEVEIKRNGAKRKMNISVK